jgi:hypothetical protein
MIGVERLSIHDLELLAASFLRQATDPLADARERRTLMHLFCKYTLMAARRRRELERGA